MKKIFVLILACMMIIPVIAADLKTGGTETVGEAEITKEVVPVLTVQYEGKTDIATSLAAKSSLSEKVAVLKTATVTAFAAEKYPIIAKNTSETTNVTIDAYRCEAERCAYWVTAYRDGQKVYIDNPVWLITGNAPYHIVVSDVVDTKANTETITLKEDPKGAVLNIMATFAEMQPVIGQKKVVKE